MNPLFDQIKKLDGLSTGRSFFKGNGREFHITSPVDGKSLGSVKACTKMEYDAIVNKAMKAKLAWQNQTAPARGEIVRQYAQKLREYKNDLGELVSYEMGKSLQEGLGEVQEMIDICDFATGLSRQLYGLQMHSERPKHRMLEQWHPLGIVGIISAFNFPVAVWAWNTAIAWVCGNVCIWKPSEKTPYTAIACQYLFSEVLAKNELPEGISNLIMGDKEVGQMLAEDERISLVSATGSVRMGKSVAATVASRLGKSLLELGGNNAIIVTENADLKQAVPAIVFGSVGTCGQRCTSTRRLIIQESIFEELKNQLIKAYSQLKIGNPLDTSNHVGPLIDQPAVAAYFQTIEKAKQQGGKVLCGSRQLKGKAFATDCYIEPTIIEASADMPILKTETFAPILYLLPYKNLEEAIQIQNNVPQGLSSAIFSLNLRETEKFLSVNGSDCGIANVNIGTSGAEIGGAFGGEKETGGGRESGSDAWKAYMRRQTCTINFGEELPLAQGIKFEI